MGIFDGMGNDGGNGSQKTVKVQNPLASEADVFSIIPESMMPYARYDEAQKPYFDFTQAYSDGVNLIAMKHAQTIASEQGVELPARPMGKDEFLSKRYAERGIDNMAREVPVQVDGVTMRDVNGKPIMKENEDYKKAVMDVENEYQSMMNGWNQFSSMPEKASTHDVKKYLQGDTLFNTSLVNPDFSGKIQSHRNYTDATHMAYTNESLEEKMFRYGGYYDKTTGEYKPIGGWWDRNKDIGKEILLWHSDIIHNLESAITFGFIDGWIDGNQRATNEWIGEPKKLFLDYDDKGNPYLAMDYSKNIERPANIISVFGPQALRSEWYESAGKALMGFLPSLLAIPSTVHQYGHDVMHSIQYMDWGKEADPSDIRYSSSLAVQNSLVSMRMKQSEYASENQWSAEGLWYLGASVVPQMVMVAYTGGAGIPKLGMTILSLMSAVGYNEEARNNNVSRGHTLWALPVLTTAMYLTENMGPNIFWKTAGQRATKSAAPKVVSELFGDYAQNGIKDKSASWFGGLWNSFRGKTMTKSKIGQFAWGLAEEGPIEEGSQQVIENGIKIVNDWYERQNEEMNTLTGFRDKQFFQYENGNSLGTMLGERLFDNWAYSVVGGMIGAGIGPITNYFIHKSMGIKNQTPENSMWAYFAEGKEKYLLQAYNHMVKNNLIGRTGYDEEGKPIEAGKSKTSETDFLYARFMDTYNMMAQVKASVLNSGMMEAMNFDPKIMEQSMKLIAQKNKLTEELKQANIENAANDTEEGRQKIAQLQTQLQATEKEINDWAMPDTQNGSKRSKAYNTGLREVLEVYGVARQIADGTLEKEYGRKLTDKDRGKDEYLNVFKKALLFTEVGMSKASASMKSSQNQRISKLKGYYQARIAEDAKFTMASIENLSTSLEAFSKAVKDGADSKAIAQSLNSLIAAMSGMSNTKNDIDAIGEFAKSDGQSAELLNKYKDMYQNAMNTLKSLGTDVKSMTYDGKSISSILEENEGEDTDSIMFGSNVYTTKTTSDDQFIKNVNEVVSHAKALENMSPEVASSLLSSLGRSEKSLRESRENNERQIAALEHTIDAKGTSKKEKEKAQNKLIQLKKLRDAMKNEKPRSNYSYYTEHEMYYFSDIIARIMQLEDAANKGFKEVSDNTVDKDGNVIIGQVITAEQALKEVYELSQKLDGLFRLGQYDLALGTYLKSNKNDATSYDNGISNDVFNEVFGDDSIINSLRDRINSIADASASSIGIDNDYLTTALHARMRLINIRHIFRLFLDDNGAETKFAEEFKKDMKGVTDAEKILEKVYSLMRYEKKDGNDYNKYDITKDQTTNLGLLTDEEAMETTKELDAMLVEIETFLTKNRKEFFTDKRTKLIVEDALYRIWITDHANNTVVDANGNASFKNSAVPGIFENLKHAVNTYNVGYLNASFLNEGNGMSSMTFLRMAVHANLSGQAELPHDPTMPAKTRMATSTREATPIEMNQFKYKMLMNYMVTIYGSSADENIGEYLDEMKAVKDKKRSFRKSYEQFMSHTLVKSAKNGGREFFDKMMFFEKSYLKEQLLLLKAKSEDIAVDKVDPKDKQYLMKIVDLLYSSYSKDFVAISGDFGTGKTIVMVPSILGVHFKDELAAGKKGMTFTLVVNTDKLRSEITENINKQYGEGTFIINFVHTSDALNKSTMVKDDVVIWDEASLIPSTYFNDSKPNNLIKGLTGKKVYFLGDYSQMTSAEGSSYPKIFNSGLTSMPFNRKYSVGYKIIIDAAARFRERISFLNENKPMINGGVTIDPETKIKVGLEYVEPGSTDKVVSAFIANDSPGDSALIITSRKDFVEDKNGYYALLKDADGKLKEEYRNGSKVVYVIQEDISEYPEEGMPVAVQGLRASNVFITVDEALEKMNNDYVPSYINRQFYTSVSRSSRYIMMIGDVKLNDKAKMSDLLYQDPTSEIANDMDISYFESIRIGSKKTTATSISQQKAEAQAQAQNDVTGTTGFSSSEMNLIKDGYVLTNIKEKDGKKTKYYYRNDGKVGITLFVSENTSANGKTYLNINRIEEHNVSVNGKTFAIRFSYNETFKESASIFVSMLHNGEYGNNHKFEFKGQSEVSSFNKIKAAIEMANKSGVTFDMTKIPGFSDGMNTAVAENVIKNNQFNLSPIATDGATFSQTMPKEYHAALQSDYINAVLNIAKQGSYDIVANIDGTQTKVRFEDGKWRYIDGSGNEVTLDDNADSIALLGRYISDYLSVDDTFVGLYPTSPLMVAEKRFNSADAIPAMGTTVGSTDVEVGTVYETSPGVNEEVVSIVSSETGDSDDQVVLKDDKGTVRSVPAVEFVNQNKNKLSGDAVEHDELNDDDVFRKRRRTELAKTFDNPIYTYVSPILDNGYFTSHTNMSSESTMDILNTIRVAKMLLLQHNISNYKYRMVVVANPRFVSDDGSSRSNSQYAFMVKIDNSDGLLESVNNIMMMSNDITQDQKEIMKKVLSNAELQPMLINALTNIMQVETLKVVGKSGITNVMVYNKNGNLRSKKDILAEIDSYYSNITDDASGKIYNNFIETVYNSLPKKVSDIGKDGTTILDRVTTNKTMMNKNNSFDKVTGSDALSMTSFKENLNKRWIRVESMFVRAKHNNKQKTAIKINTPYGYSSQVFVMPKKAGIASVIYNGKPMSYYDMAIQELREHAESLTTVGKQPNTLTDQFTQYTQLSFIRMLTENRSVLSSDANKVFLKLLSANFVYNAKKRIYLPKRSTGLEKSEVMKAEGNAILSFLKSLDADPNMQDMFRSMRIPVDMSKITSENSSSDLFDINVQNIDMPGVYVSFTNHDLLSPGKKDYGMDIFNDDDPFMTQDDDLKAENFNNFQSVYKRIIGKNYDDFVHYFGMNSAAYDGRTIYGAYQRLASGRHRLLIARDENGNVISLAPRHEIFHLVFRNFIKKTEQARLLSAAKNIMSQEKGISIDGITDKDAEEWMANDYAANNQRRIKEQYGLFNKMIGRFFAFLNRLGFDVFHNDTLGKMYANIEYGGFRNNFSTANTVDNSVNEHSDEIVNEAFMSSERIDDDQKRSVSESKRRTQQFIIDACRNQTRTYNNYKRKISRDVFLRSGLVNTQNPISIDKAIMDTIDKYSKMAADMADNVYEIDGVKYSISNKKGYKQLNNHIVRTLAALNPQMAKDWEQYAICSNIKFMIEATFGWSYVVNSKKTQASNFNNFDRDYSRISSTDSVSIILKNFLDSIPDPNSPNRFLDYDEVNRTIADTSIVAQALIESGEKDDIMDAFKEALEKRAAAQFLSPDARRICTGILNTINTLNDIVLNDKLSAEMKDDARDMLTRIEILVQSSHNQSLTRIRYEDGVQKLYPLFRNAAEAIKHRMKDNVHNACFGTNTLVNPAVMAMFQKGIRNKALYTFEKDGMYYNGSSTKSVKLIDIVNGTPKFTQEAYDNREIIFDMLEKIGIKLNFNLKKAILPLNEKVNSDLAKIVSRYYSGIEVNPQEIFSGIVYSMMSSMYQWSMFTDAVSKSAPNFGDRSIDLLTEEQKKDGYTLAKKNIEKAIDTLMSGGYSTNSGDKAFIENVLSHLGADINNLDDIASNYLEEDMDSSYIPDVKITNEKGEELKKVNYYKPTDFYNFFSMLGAIVQSNYTSENISRGYGDNNKSYPTNVLHTHLTRKFNAVNNVASFHNMGNKIRSRAEKIIKSANAILGSNPGKAEIKKALDFIGKSNLFSKHIQIYIEDGVAKYEFTNPVLAGKGIVPQSITHVITAKDRNVTDTMSPADATMIAMDRFVLSMKNYKKLAGNMQYGFDGCIMNMSDRLSYYIVHYGMDKRYMSISENKDGTTDVHFDKEAIVNNMMNILEYHRNATDLSLARWTSVVGLDSGITHKLGDDIEATIAKLNVYLATRGQSKKQDIMAKLYADTDYRMDKEGNITLGFQPLMNQKIWNLSNYNKLKAAMKDGVESAYEFTTDMLLTEYFKFAKTLSSTGYRLNDEYRNVTSDGVKYNGKYDYYTFKDNTLTSNIKSVDINPLTFGFFMMDMMSRPMLDTLLMNDAYAYGGSIMQTKRLKVVSTAVNTMKYSNKRGERGNGIYGEHMNVIVTASQYDKINTSTSDTKFRMNLEDGLGRIGLLGTLYWNSSFGGRFKMFNDGMSKPLVIDADYSKDSITQIKLAVEHSSSSKYERFPEYREMEKLLLNTTSANVNKILNDFTNLDGTKVPKIDLAARFDEFYAQTKDAGVAAQMLKQYIENHRYGAIIEDNITAGVFDESTIKTGLYGLIDAGINDIGSVYDRFNGEVPHMRLNSDSFGIVTNLSKDIIDDLKDGVAAPSQVYSGISQRDTLEHSYSKDMIEVADVFFDAGMKKIQEALNEIKVPEGELYPEEYKMLTFLRNIAKDAIDFMGGDANFGNIISNTKLTLDMPGIRQKVNQAYMSYINRLIVKPRAYGFRGNVVSGKAMMFFKDAEGNRYNLSRLEKLYGFTFNRSMIKGNKLIVSSNLEFEVERLKRVTWDDKGEMVHGTIAMANPVLKQYKMSMDEDIDAVYTINYSEAGEHKFVNLQSKSNSSRISTIISMLKDHYTGTSTIGSIDSILTGDISSANVVFRVLSSDIKELDNAYKNNESTTGIYSDIEKELKIYFEEFEKSLDVVEVRVPYGHDGQMAVHRIVSFINDSGNDVYKDMSGSILMDDDCDGDQNAYILYDMNNYNTKSDQLKKYGSNKFYEICRDSYMNPANRAKIDISSNVANIERKIEHMSNRKRKEPVPGSFAAQVQGYTIAQAGSEAIGIAAAFSSAYSELMKLDPTIIDRYTFLSNRTYGDLKNVLPRLIGNMIQVILNNGKTAALGMLGVPSIGVPLVMTYLTMYDGTDTSEDAIIDDMIIFFTKDNVSEILNKISSYDRIGNEEYFVKLLPPLYDAVNRAKAEIKGINLSDDEIAEKRLLVNTAADNISKKFDELKKALEGHKDLYRLMKMDLNNILGDVSILNEIEEGASLIKNKEQRNEYIRSKLLESISEVNNSHDYKNAISRISGYTSKKTDIIAVKKLLDEFMDGIREDRAVIAKDVEMLRRIDNEKDMSKMYQYAVYAERSRQLSDIIRLRNGLDTDLYSSEYDNISMYLGTDLKYYVSPSGNQATSDETKEEMVARSIKYYKEHSNQYWLESDDAKVERDIKIMEDVYGAIDIGLIMKKNAFSRYYNNLEFLANKYDPINYYGKRGLFLDEHILFSSAKQWLLSDLHQGSLTNRQKVEFNNTFNDVLLDIYFKLWTQRLRRNVPFQISPMNITEDNGVKHVGGAKWDHLQQVHLNSKGGRNHYQTYFPLWVKQMKDLANSIDFSNETPLTAARVAFVNNDETTVQMMEWLPYFSDISGNAFIQNYGIETKRKSYLSFDNTQSLGKDEKERYMQELDKLPKPLQDMFFHYELIRNVFRYSKGSAYDAMNPNLYNKLSNWRNEISDIFTNIYNNPQMLSDFNKAFSDSFMSKKSALLRLGSKSDVSARKAGWSKRTEDGKLFPGDGHAAEQSSSKRGIRYFKNNYYWNKTIYELTEDGTKSIKVSMLRGRGIDLSHIISTTYKGEVELSPSTHNESARLNVSRFPVTHALKSESVANLENAHRFGNDNAKYITERVQFPNPAKYNKDTIYITENGIPLKATKVDEDGYQWEFRLATLTEQQLLEVESLLYEEETAAHILAQRDYEENFPNAVRAFGEITSQKELSLAIEVVRRRTDVIPTVVFLSDNLGSHSSGIGSMLINGTLNGYMSMGNMGNDYATAGKTKLHDGSKGSSYAIPVSRKVQGNDGTFQNDAKQYTREELISNLKEFFDMAMLNQGNQYIFALSPGGRNTIAKIEGEANMSDFRFAEVLAEVLKEYPGLSNVTFTTHYAKIINDINLDSSLEAKIKKINEDRGTKQYKCK